MDGTNNLDPTRPRLLNDTELAAFQGYIRSGGGYVGLHAATDSMHTVPWYSQLTGGGARFVSHPQQQTATMRVENPSHPSTAMLPTEWVRFDEWYNFSTNPRDDVHVLITLDESTYSPGRNAMGADHPIAWCHNFEGGRSWYEGAGHTDASWADPLFLEHVLKGIEWTAGLVSGGGDCVTFGEVDSILAGLSDGSMRYTKLSSQLATYLDQAEAAADAGDHAGAIETLTQAQGKAHGLQDEVLVSKLGTSSNGRRGCCPDLLTGSPARVRRRSLVPDSAAFLEDAADRSEGRGVVPLRHRDDQATLHDAAAHADRLAELVAVELHRLGGVGRDISTPSPRE